MLAEMTFSTAGNVRTLYHELIPLQKLGELSVKRASHLEFNEVTQQWEVLTVDRQTVLYTHPRREACLAWERISLEPEN